MKGDWQFSVKLWRDGSWAITAMPHDAGSGTLIESDGKAAARIVIANRQRSIEVTAQPVLYSKGLGRAVISAMMNQDGTRLLKSHRIFPNGAVRIDEVRRRGSKGERRSVWTFANGSRIVGRATDASQHLEFFDRQERLTGSRMTQIVARMSGEITFHTNVSDSNGKTIGRLSGRAQLRPGGKMRIMSGEGPAVPSRSEVRAAQVSAAPSTYNNVTKNRDGTVTVTNSQSDGNRTFSTETTYDAVGAAKQTVQSVTQSGDSGSNTTTTTGVLTFWLFAQTTLNISPDMGHDLGVGASMMNTAVALTALFSGIFIVVIGGVADHMGRVRTVRVGFYLSILGSLLVGLAPANHFASSFLLTGRALQGLSGACIMPASLALVKTYWNGAARQRAISLWSIGSWGGSGVSALFGGLVTESLALLPAPLGPMSVVLSSKLIVVAVPPKHRKFLKVMLSMFMTWPHALLDGKGREQPFAARRNRPLTSRSSLSTSSLRVTHPESAALRRGIALF